MNPSECPDSTVWYNPDYGEATAGEIRTVAQEDPLEATFRYWGWMCTRNLTFDIHGKRQTKLNRTKRRAADEPEAP